MPRKRVEIDYVSTEVTYEQLKKIEKGTSKSKTDIKELLLDDITIADNVFQPRYFSEGGKLDGYHVLDLIAGIKVSKNGPLAPMLVFPLGGKFYLVDGHHRYAAYRSMKPTPWFSDKPVPVEVFEGDLDGAVLECGIRNNQNKLPMCATSKQEYAWNLVKLDVGSIKEQHLASGLAKSTISRMRNTLKELGATKAQGLQWSEVLRLNRQQSERDSEAYFDLKALQLAEAIKKSTDLKLVKHYDVLANAIELIHPTLTNNLIMHWTGRTMEDIGGMDELGGLDI
ncbi:ParB/RepB/Spo0J family partition protein [Methylobacterium komagatae]